MSKGFSFAQIGGVLGRDPESRSTPNGVKVVTFSVAVEKGFGDKASTSWFNVVAFDKNADFAEKYLKKGKSVIVSGDLQIKSWDDKQTGAKRQSTEVIARSIDFADTGTRSEGGTTRQAPAPRQQAAPQPRAATVDPFQTELADDDIPF